MKWLRRHQGKWHAMDKHKTISVCERFVEDGKGLEDFMGATPPDLACFRCLHLLKRRAAFAKGDA